MMADRHASLDHLKNKMFSLVSDLAILYEIQSSLHLCQPCREGLTPAEIRRDAQKISQQADREPFNFGHVDAPREQTTRLALKEKTEALAKASFHSQSEEVQLADLDRF
jgi:hypothetical protein